MRTPRPADYGRTQEVVVRVGPGAPGVFGTMFSEAEVGRIKRRMYGLDVLSGRKCREIPSAWEIA